MSLPSSTVTTSWRRGRNCDLAVGDDAFDLRRSSPSRSVARSARSASRPRSAAAGAAPGRCRAPGRAWRAPCRLPAPDAARRRLRRRSAEAGGHGRILPVSASHWHGPVRPHSMRAFTLGDFDFALPPELIAQHPAAERSASRLLDGTRRARRATASFATCPTCCAPATCWSFNDTRVIKARLFGVKASGGAVEAAGRARAAGPRRARPRAREQVAAGRAARLRFGAARFDADGAGPRRRRTGRCSALRFPRRAARAARAPRPRAAAALHRRTPTTADDERRYQTVFAERARARSPRRPRRCISTPRCWPRCAARGVERASVTLHVGAGTFQPVRTENLAEHSMHSEWYEVAAGDAAGDRARARARGGRVVAVGTTTLRALESAAAHGGRAAGRQRRHRASSSRRASSSASSTC